MTPQEIVASIDYTLLKPDATLAQIEELCFTAVQNGYYAVCVPPWSVRSARAFLTRMDLTPNTVKVCTVVGFPLGYQVTQIKAAECEKALADDAQEIDMMINLSAFKSGNLRIVAQEINTLRRLTLQTGAVLKVIVESGLLNFEELATVIAICDQCGVDFVKTSTGFNGVGAEIDKVKFMRQHLSPQVKIKASGGIRTAEEALAFIRAGAMRIGTSTAITFVPAL
jgi:deoxyribose-phosphate aldolase